MRPDAAGQAQVEAASGLVLKLGGTNRPQRAVVAGARGERKPGGRRQFVLPPGGELEQRGVPVAGGRSVRIVQFVHDLVRPGHHLPHRCVELGPALQRNQLLRCVRKSAIREPTRARVDGPAARGRVGEAGVAVEKELVADQRQDVLDRVPSGELAAAFVKPRCGGPGPETILRPSRAQRRRLPRQGAIRIRQ